ncbi:phosphoglycerate mutase-like protein [Xylaria intraflava]|nr:phosphoglycerate mutase-like protein [Xylaria intraflava]
MSLEVIYVVRHGFRSAWSVDHLTGIYTAHIRSPTGLPTDPALTSHGVEQAGELAEHLLRLDPPIDQVYSSPYYRCLQTISPFVSRRNSTRNTALASQDVVTNPHLSIRVESGLSEWYGRAHFEHPTSAPLDDLSPLFADLDTNYVSCFAPQRRGESIPQLYKRVASCMQDIITKCDQEGKKAVIICTHAAVVIALGRILTAKIPEDVSVADFGAFTCGLSTYRRQKAHEDCSATAVINMVTTTESQVQKHLDARSTTQAGDTQSTRWLHSMDHPKLGSRGPGDPGLESPPQICGFGLASHWTCEANSDCSFLRAGEERGWQFSGDESFIETDRDSISPSIVEPRLNAVVEAEENSPSSTGASKL